MKMTKQKLISAIKAKDKAISSYGKKSFYSFILMMLSMPVIGYFYSFEQLIDKNIIFAGMLIIFFIIMLVVGPTTEKRIYRETNMLCENCNRPYSTTTFAVAVLENRCQYCGAQIYDI